jgi:hypothetical protein
MYFSRQRVATHGNGFLGCFGGFDRSAIRDDQLPSVATTGSIRAPSYVVRVGYVTACSRYSSFSACGAPPGDGGLHQLCRRLWLPERECVRLGAGLEEGDLQCPLADRVVLAHELVEAAVPKQAAPVLTDVDAV